MARIATVDEKTVQGEVAGIFAEIEGAFGKVPNLFLTYANHPPLLKANWNKVKAVMGEGTLSQKAKQAIPCWFPGTTAAPIAWRPIVCKNFRSYGGMSCYSIPSKALRHFLPMGERTAYFG